MRTLSHGLEEEVWLRLGWLLGQGCVSVWSRQEGTRQPHTTCGLNTHSQCTEPFDPPPTCSLVLTLSSSPRTSLFIQPHKLEKSSFNHVAPGLEREFFNPWSDAARCLHVSNPLIISFVWNPLLFVSAVCNKMTKYRAISPFLCMDMTYITCLLKEGFGFKDNTVLQVSTSDLSYCVWGCRSRKEIKHLNEFMTSSVCCIVNRPSIYQIILIVGRVHCLFCVVWFWWRSSCHSAPQLAKKVNNVETSWALGATFDYFRNLNIH